MEVVVGAQCRGVGLKVSEQRSGIVRALGKMDWKMRDLK